MANVVEALSKTSKGQLKYYTNWTPRDLIIEKPEIPLIHQEIEVVFEIKSIKAALEAIEDDAFEYAANLDEEEAKESFKINENENTSLEEEYEAENYGTCTDFFNSEHALQEWERSIEEERRRHKNREYVRKREEFFEEIARKTFEAAKLRREKERKVREEQEEKERKFFEILEESAIKIRKNMQKHEDDIIRTRQQQERERQLRFQLLEKQRQKETYEKFKRITQEIEITCKEIFTKIQNFDYRDSPEYSQSRIPSIFENCAQIFSATAAVSNNVKSPENLNEQQIPDAENNLRLIKSLQKNLTEEVQSVVKIIESRKIQEKKQQELVAKQQKEAAEAERQLSKPPPTPSTPKQASQSKERYQKLKAKMAEYEEIDSKLKSSKSAELKKLVIHMSKAIGHPIASITGRSGSDVKRVARILTSILKNNEVTVGNKKLSTKGNSFAIKFAENLMAKKLVLQAVQNSANFSSSFSIASIVITLWAESSDFGDLFMAHLQSKCMYTVPRYHTLTDTGGSNEDQWKAMGYEVSNGEIEEDDKFLHRMSGLIRLYAAIIQSPLPPGVSKHPHGLAKGWQWIAELLNMNPRPDITTTILHNFLEVAGHEMMTFYKKQFEKILFVICHDFYPKLEAATKDKASLARLKLFLEKCVKDKRFPIPEGRLDKNFWKTYHSGEVVGE